MITQDAVLELFRATGAYLQGHFRLTSGLHSPEYLQCALVLAHPEHAETLGQALGARLKEFAGKVDVVVSPAMGGLMIGHEVARALGVRDAPQGLYDLAKGLGAPIALKDIGMPESGLDRAADLAVANPYWNPRPIERAAIRALLDDAFWGRRPGAKAT